MPLAAQRWNAIAAIAVGALMFGSADLLVSRAVYAALAVLVLGSAALAALSRRARRLGRDPGARAEPPPEGSPDRAGPDRIPVGVDG
jgi:hypothetical protein